MLQPRYYQQQAIDAFFNYTKNNWGKHPIIVLPTGAGKSLVQAYITKKILEYDNTRILLITHQQELIKQNYLELVENFNNEIFLDIGIYSAGLKCRDTNNRIIFAGIQSVYKKAWELGWFDVVIVDECHLIPHKGRGMYRNFMSEMIKINKNIVIAGLSATPYRLKDGFLCEGEGALFDEICHETTIKELINPNHPLNLDNTQYLCPLISPKKSMKSSVDLAGVHIRGGEYVPKEMQSAFQKDDLVCKAVKEIKEYTIDRNNVLVFTAGIAHCEEVCKKMDAQGMDARFIHSQQADEINEQNIKDFKNGIFKYLINVDKLTTGFNKKSIDCIVLLRSTLSPGLYSQMCGRGLRLHITKENCLILDFGGNILKHGPIDKIEVRSNKKTGTKEIQTAPQKECPQCQTLLHLSCMECIDCGYIFPSKDKHEDKASKAEILSVWKKPEEIDIERICYWRHEKKGKPDSLRVDYYLNQFDKYSSWICIEHGGFAGTKAQQWLKNVTDMEINTVSDALDNCKNFREPVKIIVDTNGKYPNITGYIFDNEIKKDIDNKTEIIQNDKIEYKIEDLQI